MKISDSLSDSKPLREFLCILSLGLKKSMGKAEEKCLDKNTFYRMNRYCPIYYNKVKNKSAIITP